MIDYNQLPDTARIWVYLSNRCLTAAEQSAIIEKGTKFLKSWSAHGDKLSAGITIKNDLLLVLAVDESQTEASGCSIDTSTAFIKQLEETNDLSLRDWQNMAYRNTDTYIPFRRNDLPSLIDQNILTDSTELINTNIITKYELEHTPTYLLSESSFKHLLTPNR